MHLHLHPKRHEALMASISTLTRWSLDTNPATILAQMSTIPESVFSLSYDTGGRLHAFGGASASPDGVLFAHQHLIPQEPRYWGVMPVIDWRCWDDFSLSRIGSEPYTSSGISSLASSPDGRWLAISPWYPERIFLLDWQTGEIMSHHATAGRATALMFDPTSTFVAGAACNDSGGHLMLWQIDSAERFVPRLLGEEWWTRDTPPDVVSGSMALKVVHWELDRTGIEWPSRDLADMACQSAFSPDSQMAIFSPMNSGYSDCGLELVAYEIPSGRRLWCVRHNIENSGSFLLNPDGTLLLVPVQGSDLLVYRVADGTLEQRLHTGLNEPVQALAFDHDGKTLWLATEERLVQYQPES